MQEERFIDTNGIRLHVVLDGPEAGELVVLLHGFPDHWYGWRRQIAPLAEAGYRVMAPDQRGYNTSAKPAGVRAYALDALAEDVLGLIEAAGREQAVLVGHDWGAAVAWWTAISHPRRVAKLAVLNVPHPAVLRHALRRDVRQMARSAYMFGFQVPKLPEALLRFGGGRPMFSAVRRTARPGTFDDAHAAPYLEAWQQPGALTGMLNWYRALLRFPPRMPDRRVGVPALIIWGEREPFLRLELAHRSVELCDRGRLVVIDGATHWVHVEEAARVNGLLLDFLSRPQE